MTTTPESELTETIPASVLAPFARGDVSGNPFTGYPIDRRKLNAPIALLRRVAGISPAIHDTDEPFPTLVEELFGASFVVGSLPIPVPSSDSIPDLYAAGESMTAAKINRVAECVNTIVSGVQGALEQQDPCRFPRVKMPTETALKGLELCPTIASGERLTSDILNAPIDALNRIFFSVQPAIQIIDRSCGCS